MTNRSVKKTPIVLGWAKKNNVSVVMIKLSKEDPEDDDVSLGEAILELAAEDEREGT